MNDHPIQRSPNVVLVSMPWTTVFQPSLGLAVLAAHLRADNLPCKVYHANLELLKYVSLETYDAVAQCWGVNDFVFTALLDNSLDGKQIAHLRAAAVGSAHRKWFKGYSEASEIFELFLALRNRVIPRYLADCAEHILSLKPTMVGFTCLFDQTMASVALAKLLKERAPELMIALGGYAVQHANGMEVLRAFPFIDCVAQGDGEPVIVRLARASSAADSIEDIEGVVTRALALSASPSHPKEPPQARLADAYTPDYDDWFDDLRRLEADHKVRIVTQGLPIESSRGCWWGQKHHCTFCGIDENSLRYRLKSADQVVSEIRELRRRYGDDISFRFADYILPHQFHTQLLPVLADFNPPLELECEIKANQTRDGIRRFAAAGFKALQPGIESFSSVVLNRMDKGVSSIKNVQLLKWGYLERITIHYNILWGFPGETVEEYQALVAALPKLYHLIPPVSRSGVVVTRFAPLQVDPARFRISRRPVHHSLYDVMFSDKFLDETGFSLDDYCYYFERPYEFDPGLNELYSQLVHQTNHWKAQHQTRDVHLSYERTPTGFVFDDSRFADARQFPISGMAAKIYEMCDGQAVSKIELIRRCEVSGDQALEDFTSGLQVLDMNRLIWTEG